jgi:hypothetical protein
MTSNFMVCSKLLFSVEAIRRCFSNTTGRYRAEQTQREDASSLPAAGFARHPSPTSAGLFMPATPALRIARGPTPTRPQAVSPIFRAALVQTSAIAPPFPLRPAPLQGWGYPSACACYPPPSPGGVRHLVSNAAHKRENKGATDMTSKKYNAEFQPLALASIHESTTNPHSTFDESKLAESFILWDQILLRISKKWLSISGVPAFFIRSARTLASRESPAVVPLAGLCSF